MITTDFFKKLYEISAIGTFNISLKVGSNNMILMSMVFTSETGSPQDKRAIPPIVLKGTVEEFSEQFFDNLKTPIAKTNQFFMNIEQHNKALDKAKLNLAKSAQKNNNNPSKGNGTDVTDQQEDEENETELYETVATPVVNKEERKKTYADAMAEIDKLVTRFKYEEALAILPSVTDYPEKEKQILAKEKDLKFQSRQYSLLP